MKRLSEMIIKYRYPIIIVYILITAFSVLQLRNIEVDPEIKNMLSSEIKSRVDTDRIEEVFGGTDLLMIIFESENVLEPETLLRVKNISKKINRLKEVDKVISLFDLKDISGTDGYMLVEPAVDRIPESASEEQELKERLKGNSLVYEIAVSKDFTATAIIATITENVSDIEIISKVKEIVAEFPGDEKLYYGGMPFTRISVASDIKQDILRFLPAGIVIMLVFLFISFRQLRGVILPFLVVVMSILLTMALIPLLGWKISMPLTLLPVMMIAIANDYGIHMIAKYQEENVPGNNLTKEQLASGMFMSLGKPVIITGLTTIAGMMCLRAHILLPARQLAVLASTGIAYALSASLLFIPALTSIIKTAKPLHTLSGKVHFLDRILHSFSDSVIRYPGKIINFSIIITLLASSAIFMLKIDANPENYYPENHPIVVSSEIINDKLGGSQNISIMFTGDIKSPGMMNKINNYENDFKNLEWVGNTSSIAQAVHEISKAVSTPDDPYYDRIPDSREAIAQYFELYNMSGDPEDFDKLVDFPYENAHLMVRINNADTPAIKGVADKIKKLTENDSTVTAIGGWGMIFTDLADMVIEGQIYSLLLSIIIVSFLLMILFKSFKGGLFAIIPLLISVILLFSLMGLFRIELNIATALLSSIMIGVGVDYTIHFLWRYREELSEGRSYSDAVKTTLTTTGRGIVYNAFSVIVGFVVLLFSSFQPVKFFGFLVLITIFACLAGALLFIPALCIKYKPAFLEKKISRGEKNV